jgi:alpha-1,4-galacturonosyltransferase
MMILFSSLVLKPPIDDGIHMYESLKPFVHVSFTDLTIERLGEHKNRVLSATDHWQVVDTASKRSDASLVREELESQNADESQNASGVDKELPHTIDVEHSDGSDESGQNNVSGTHATG